MWIYANSTQDMLRQKRYKNKVYRDKAYQKKINYVRNFVVLMQIYRLYMKNNGIVLRKNDFKEKFGEICWKENCENLIYSNFKTFLKKEFCVIYKYFHLEFVLDKFCVEFLSKNDAINFMINVDKKSAVILSSGFQDKQMLDLFGKIVFNHF